MMADSSIALNKLTIYLNFSKLGMHIEKNGHRNGHHMSVTLKASIQYI